jgi:hypothetical protein
MMEKLEVKATNWQYHQGKEELAGGAVDTVADWVAYLASGNNLTLGRRKTHQQIIDEIKEAMEGDWSLVNPQGKIAKRLEKILWDKWRVGFEATDFDRLSRTIEGCMIRPFFFRISDQINWSPGEYGDRSSCWWRERVVDRAAFIGGGGHAFQIATPLASGGSTPLVGTGKARAMLLPHNNRVFMFNAYGMVLPAMLEAFKLGFDWHGHTAKVDFTLDSMIDGQKFYMYANGDSAYVMCDASLKGKDNRKVTLDGCHCSAKYNHLPDAVVKAQPVCANCPFEHKKVEGL